MPKVRELLGTGMNVCGIRSGWCSRCLSGAERACVLRAGFVQGVRGEDSLGGLGVRNVFAGFGVGGGCCSNFFSRGVGGDRYRDGAWVLERVLLMAHMRRASGGGSGIK